MNHDLDRQLIRAAIQAEMDEATPPPHLWEDLRFDTWTVTTHLSWRWAVAWVVCLVVQGASAGAVVATVSTVWATVAVAVAVGLATAFLAGSSLMFAAVPRVMIRAVTWLVPLLTRDHTMRARLREEWTCDLQSLEREQHLLRQRPMIAYVRRQRASLSKGARRRATSTGDAPRGAVAAGGHNHGADHAAADLPDTIGLPTGAWRRALLRRGDPPHGGEP